MKHIVHITTSLGVGGSEDFLFNLIKTSLSNTYKCSVITLKSGGLNESRLKAIGINVYSINMKSGSLTINSIIRFYNLCRKLKPDFLQGWMYHGNFFVLLYKLFFLKNIPILWNIRASLYNIKNEKINTRIIIYILKFFSKRIDKIIYNSKISLQQHIKFGFYNKNSLIIPNGFDLNIWQPNVNIKNQIKKKFNIPDKSLIVGFAARHHPMKDFSNFISTMELVLKKNNNIFIIMAGEGIDLKNTQVYKISQKFPLNKFILLGLVKEMNELMPAFDIFCLSSAWGEGFPNVLGQAMACEVIAVSTDIGDASYIINNKERICKPGSPKSLAKIIISLLSINDNQRNIIKKENRIFIKENFNLSLVSDKYLAVYKNLI